MNRNQQPRLTLPANFRAPTAWMMLVLIALTGVILADPANADETDYRVALADAVRTSANQVLPSVVTIEIIGTGGPVLGEVEQDAPTSGVIIDTTGHIIASSIVVRRPSASILVVLGDGTRHTASVIARDHHRDLVLLKIKTDHQLQPIDLSGNPELPIGATTIAVGRYGNDVAPIISRGVLSARQRLDGIALQTDARVSPAFYGGPLIDLYGNVLGILVPAVSQGGAPDATSWYDSGIAFAIPSPVIANKLQRLKSGDDIKQGLIGIVAKSSDPIAAGTEIAAVRNRSPAESAGIQSGDTVISIDGKPVSRHQEIRQILGSFDAGETISINVRRADREIEFAVELAETIPPLQPQRLGLVVSEQAENDQTWVIVDGVLPDSPSDGKLKAGDRLEKLDGTEINDVESLRRQLISANPDSSLKITRRRGEESETIEVTPIDIAGKLRPAVPPAWNSEGDQAWQLNEIKLPDAPNAATYITPGTDTNIAQLGLFVLLIGPGESTPSELLNDWIDAAKATGTVICAIAPETAERWQPKELDVVAKFAAAVIKQAPIDTSAVAIGTTGAIFNGKATAADSMALAVAISQRSTFFGVAVSAETRPPAVRIRENEPDSALQLLMPIESAADLPTWSAPLEQAGYPIIQGGKLDQENLLRWVRLLQSI